MKTVNDIKHVCGSQNYSLINGNYLFETSEAIKFQGESQTKWFPKKVLVKETKDICIVNYYVHNNYIHSQKYQQLRIEGI